MIIKYENSLGQIIDLNDKTYFVNANDLRNYQWSYEVVGRPTGLGGRVNRFYRNSATKNLTVAIRGSNFLAKINALHALTEPDIQSNTPGRLWLNNQYLVCYLGVSSDIVRYREKAGYAEKTLTLLAVEPFWHTETTQRFLSGAPTEITGGKRYPNRYDYRYISNTSSGTVTNSNYISSPMIITIYDATTDPSVTIGGNIYALDASISAGQRIIIDQLEKTVISQSADGTEENLFNYRSKEHDIFKYLSPGTQTVIYSGDFTFDITVIAQRSEPTWI